MEISGGDQRSVDRKASDPHLNWLEENFRNQLQAVKEGRVGVEELAQQLAAEFGKLEQEKLRDSLTGALNRGAIGAVLGQELAAVGKVGHRLGLLFVDLDHFKSINDNEPDKHAAGDRTLISVYGIFKDHAGPQSLVGRWGGEEWVIVIPHTSREEILATAQDIGKSIGAELATRANLSRTRVTASIGAVLAHDDETAPMIIKRADEAMYRAKKQRNHLFFEDDQGTHTTPLYVD